MTCATEQDPNVVAARGTLRKLRQALPLRADDVFLDLGANLCLVANWAAEAGCARVVAYEPFAPTLALAQPHPRVELRGKAVTADGRTVTMGLQQSALARGYTCSAHLQDGRKRLGGKELIGGVASDAIGAVMAELRPTVVKMDVEQSEYELIPAMPLDGVRAMFVEFHNIPHKAQAFHALFQRLCAQNLIPVVGWPKGGVRYEAGWGFKGFGFWAEVIFVRNAPQQHDLQEFLSMDMSQHYTRKRSATP